MNGTLSPGRHFRVPLLPMLPSFARSPVRRLDAIYRGRPFFDGVRARLLAGFIAMWLLVIPINGAIIFWQHLDLYALRVGGNVAAELFFLFALRLLFQGRLALAGSLTALVPILLTHVLVLVASSYVPTLDFGFKVFAVDVLFLFGGLLFAPRRVACLLFGLILAGHVAFYAISLQSGLVTGALVPVLGALLRDGLIALGFVFVLGFTVVHMIEAAHRRSDDSLRETRVLNDNLEHLVAARTRELEHLNGELVVLDGEKNAFMGMAAHDLRNPAVKIRMLAEMIELEGDFSKTRVRADLVTIAQTSTSMLGLLNDLLDVNAIEAGQVTLRPAALDASTILREVHTDYLIPAAAKGLKLMLAFPPGLPPVWADAAALRRVLDNLVSNALKFSPADKRVWLSVESVAGNRVRFAVRDEGPGLNAEDRAKLFGKYARLSAQPTGGEASTGLGLSIVKRLVEGMAGSIAVDSGLGEGATFRVDLPAAIDALPANRIESSRDTRPTLRSTDSASPLVPRHL